MNRQSVQRVANRGRTERVAILLLMVILLALGLANVALAATVTLYPTNNTAVTVTNPTNAYDDNGLGALISANNGSLIVTGFNNTNLGTVSDVTVWVKYKTSAAPSNDQYSFAAATDGANFTSTIVAQNLVNRAVYVTASLSLGALTWTDVGNLAVRGQVVKSGPADAYNLDLDVAYIVVTYSAPVCTPAAPTVNIVEAPQTITVDGGSVNYSVTVTNNDTVACANTTFNLGRSDGNAQFTSSILPVAVTVVPGASESATLTVTEQTATSGATTTTTVTASAGGHANGTDAVVTTYTPSGAPWANDPMLHNSINTASTKWGSDWGTPTGKYGAFVCETCHARGTSNIKRVKTTITAPNGAEQFPIQADATPPAGGVTFLDARDGSSQFGDDARADLTQSSNICEACHTYDPTDPRDNGTQYHGYDMNAAAAADKAHYNKQDCTTCHPHKSGFKPAACDSCHGYPPTAATAGGPNGLANNPYATGSATAGAHALHATTLGYACVNCHDGYVMPKESAVFAGQGDVSIGFSNFGATTGTYGGQAGVSYNDIAGSGTKSCASVYCHGGTIGGGAATWDGTVACGACHKNDATAMASGALGSHGKHAGNGAGQLALACTKCHPAYAANHVTGTVAWTLDTADTKFGAAASYRTGASGATAERAPSAAYGQCGNIYCHSPGQNSTGGALAGADYAAPTWGGAATCGSCHKVTVGSGLTSGSHAAHVGVTFGGSTIGCDACHTGAANDASTYASANHVNQLIDATGTYNSGGAPGNGYGTCAAANCHQTGITTNAYVTTTTWGTNDANCTSCHLASPTTGSHTKHIASTGNCSACHTNAVKDTSYADAAHGDLNIDVAVGGYAANKAIGSAFASCASVSCHSDGLAATGNTPAWGGTAGCAACHLSDMTTGSHAKHLAEVGVGCGDCHADAVKDTTAPTGGVHADGNVDVYNATPVDMGYPADRAYGSATWTTCTAASCHDQGRGGLATTPAWGASTTDCSECHASQPATGSHTAHITAGATCASCHDDATNPATETSPAAGHRDTNVDTDLALGYTQNKAKDSAFTTCATASCHNDGRNSGLTGTWGTTLNNCSECHATVPATGGHAAHVGVSFNGVAINCDDCHAGAVQGTTAPTAGHRDGNVNAAGYPVQANGSAYTTCSTASCHQSGAAANDYTVTPTWDANTANCTQCHEASPTTGSHAKHIATTNNCTACHGVNALKDTSYSDAAHGDLNIDVAVGGYSANKAIASAKESCTLSCHSDGMAATGTSPLWGNTVVGCTACHASDMATGSHDEHLAAGALCGDCHDGAVKDSNAGTAHTDGNVDVTATYATPNAAYGSATWTTCSSASCHDDGRTPNTSAAWGTTVNNCAECHATQPATGSHSAHLTAGATCGDCHTGTTQGTTVGANHRDGNVNAVGYPAQAKGSAFTTCSTATCHDTGRNSGGLTGTWGTALNNCSECHPTIPATAAHAKHVTSQTITSTIACAACHAGTTQGTTAGAGHRDGNIDVSTGAYPADKALGSAYTNCTTSYCHSDGKGTIQSVSWSATSTGCTFCHGNPPAGSHSVGDTDCSSCHNHVAAADNSFSNAALHINGSVEAQADDCTTCHGAGKSRDPEASDPDHKAHTNVAVVLSGKKISTSDYGNAAYWYNVSYDATSKPVMGCGQCHPADVSLHRNSVVNTKLTSASEAGIPAVNAKRNNGAAAAFSAGKCSAVYCHGDGVNDGTYPDSPTWDLTYGNAGLNCASCHGNNPTTNAHALHAVGIHYDTLYDDDGVGLMPAAAVPATDAGAAHGNSSTADTIGCQTCHNSTVTVEYNAGNSVCSSCHSDTNAPATGNELAVIAPSTSAHLDGAKTVAFASLTGFKAKSQLRNDITTVPALTNSWTRTNGYKGATGTSYEAGKALTPNFAAGSCSSVSCHNGIATPTWSSGSVGNCAACHTSLPQ